MQHLVRIGQRRLAMHTGNRPGGDRFVGIAGQQTTTAFTPQAALARALTFGLVACEGGMEELSGVFGGPPSLDSSSATRAVSIWTCVVSI